MSALSNKVAIITGASSGIGYAGTTGEMGATPDMSLSEWEDTIKTNLTSAFLGAKYQLPAMLDRNGGPLIFTSSFVGYTVGLSALPEKIAKSALYLASDASSFTTGSALLADGGVSINRN